MNEVHHSSIIVHRSVLLLLFLEFGVDHIFAAIG